MDSPPQGKNKIRTDKQGEEQKETSRERIHLIVVTRGKGMEDGEGRQKGNEDGVRSTRGGPPGESTISMNDTTEYVFTA